MFRIVDAATGQPIEAFATILDAATHSSIYFGNSQQDATGFRRVTLQPGTYLLTAYAQGYAPLPKPLTLMVPGPPLDVRLERQK